MSGRRVVRFIQKYDLYIAGEAAGFSPEVAEALVRDGIAKYRDPVPAQRDPTPRRAPDPAPAAPPAPVIEVADPEPPGERQPGAEPVADPEAPGEGQPGAEPVADAGATDAEIEEIVTEPVRPGKPFRKGRR